MHWKLILLALLLVTGLVLDQTGIIDWHRLRERLGSVTDQWWLPPFLVGLQAVFYTLALPGAALIPIVALLYRPLPATLIIVAGGVAGALAARHAARGLGGTGAQQATRSATYRLLQRNSDFLTLCMVRILPGFPHSVINYGCGLLQVPPGRFALAAALGFAAKGYLYAAAIYRVGEADEPADLVQFETLWPLLMLAVLLAAGRLAAKYWQQKRGK